MARAEARKKRPYMASEERRRALLDVAAGIVGRRGWSGLTAKGLALAAGVSRQLVYEHFDDGPDLYLAVMRHLFERSYRATAEVLKNPGDDIGATIREAYRIFLEMPLAERRVLRALSNEFGLDRPELHRARALMREEILGLWIPYAEQHTGLQAEELRPIVWMLTTAAWGLADLVEEGTVPAAKAKELLARFIEAILAPARSGAGRTKHRRHA